MVSPKPYFNAVIVDPLPSNIEILNTTFQTEQSSLSKFMVNNTGSAEYYWWDQSQPIIEYRDDRVIITHDYMRPGLHEFSYLVRPTVKGTSIAPCGSAKLMYEPEVFGRTDGGSLTVY